MLKRRRTRGMTLVELLVVITILMLLAGFMIPRIPGVVQGQRVREASQAVHVAISTAQGRARELGRPCGIRIESRPGGSLLRVVETRPGFSGWTENAMGTVAVSSGTVTLTLTEGVPTTVESGSRLRIGGRRPELEIDSITTDPSGNCVITAKSDGSGIPWASGAIFRASYLITPNPESPQFVGSARRPIVLPAQTCVDLGWSGEDSGCWGMDPLRFKSYPLQAELASTTDRVTSPLPSAVTILFESDGSLFRVSKEYPQYSYQDRDPHGSIGTEDVADYTRMVSVDVQVSKPVRSVCLMVGRPDQIESDPDLGTSGVQVLSDAKAGMPIPVDRTNLADGDCRWIAINAMNGKTTTNLNIAQYGELFNAYVASSDEDRLSVAVNNARLLVRSGGNATGN